MKYLKRLSLKIADFQSRLILIFVFFIIAPIFSIISKKVPSKKSKGWNKWPYKSDSLEDLKKQY